MFDLIYYRYILRFVKNAFFPDIDYKIYNDQQTRELKNKAQNDREIINNVYNYYSFTYNYFLNYIDEFIKYFNIDPSKYYKLNKEYSENKYYILN